MIPFFAQGFVNLQSVKFTKPCAKDSDNGDKYGSITSAQYL